MSDFCRRCNMRCLSPRPQRLVPRLAMVHTGLADLGLRWSGQRSSQRRSFVLSPHRYRFSATSRRQRLYHISNLARGLGLHRESLTNTAVCSTSAARPFSLPSPRPRSDNGTRTTACGDRQATGLLHPASAPARLASSDAAQASRGVASWPGCVQREGGEGAWIHSYCSPGA